MNDITNDDLDDTAADDLEGGGSARAAAREASTRLLELLIKHHGRPATRS